MGLTKSRRSCGNLTPHHSITIRRWTVTLTHGRRVRTEIPRRTCGTRQKRCGLNH
ncbi:hypothetical protein HanIR_Chr13g0666991 [Helianthus annuus]|nr:hypothetical protein HanIR_Chr13g0666991 [Helianthus annuus]